MTSRKKVLLVSYAFPPIPYGGTFRALRLCRGLVNQHDFECHVLTLKEYPDFPNDHDLLEKVPNSVRIHRAPIFDPWRRYQGVKARHTGKNWFKVLNQFVSFALRFITFPDHMLFWVPFAVNKAQKVIKEEKIDTILVSSPPNSSQIVGWWLKKRLNISWVADFRDPIFGNVAQVNLINPTKIMDKIEKKLLLKYEGFILRSADFLVANTETHAASLRQKGLVNVQAIRNSFDQEDFPKVGSVQNPVMTIAHVGSIYGNRKPDLFFAAIKKLATQYGPDPLKLKALFVGLGGGGLSDKIQEFGIEEYVTLVGQIPHHEAIETMCNADLLLLIKATGKWSKGQIPGKFFEYIGSGNQILCIGPKDSELATLIQERELGFVVEDDLDELVGVLRSVYNRFLRNGTVEGLTDQQIYPFGADMMVKKMSDVIKGAGSGGAAAQ